MRENFFTQADRVIGYANIEEKNIDKGNMTEENKELMKNSM
jgi:hypothetical protein